MMTFTGYPFGMVESGGAVPPHLTEFQAYMDRHFLDLNKHAFDLNQHVLDLSLMGFYAAEAPPFLDPRTFSEPSSICHKLAATGLWLPHPSNDWGKGLLHPLDFSHKLAWKEQTLSGRGKFGVSVERCKEAWQFSNVPDKPQEAPPPIKIVESPPWLPQGWITEVKTRKTGCTAGTKDKYYKDPVSGRRFRSKNEVTIYLQTGRISRYKPKLISSGGKVAGSALTKVLPSNGLISVMDRSYHDADGQRNSSSVGSTMREPFPFLHVGAQPNSASLRSALHQPSSFSQAAVLDTSVTVPSHYVLNYLPELPIWLTKVSQNPFANRVSPVEPVEPVSDFVKSVRWERPAVSLERTGSPGVSLKRQEARRQADNVVCSLSLSKEPWKISQEKNEGLGAHVEREGIIDLNLKQRQVKDDESTVNQPNGQPSLTPMEDDYGGATGQQENRNQNDLQGLNDLHGSVHFRTPQAQNELSGSRNLAAASSLNPFKDAGKAGQNLQITGDKAYCNRSTLLPQRKPSWINQLGPRRIEKLKPQQGKQLLAVLGKKLCLQGLGLTVAGSISGTKPGSKAS